MRLELQPLRAFRDYHALAHANAGLHSHGGPELRRQRAVEQPRKHPHADYPLMTDALWILDSTDSLPAYQKIL